MSISIRRAEERGHANFGWLDSHHSFSFGHYYDPKYMGHGQLRVINDDWVSAGSGFDTHPHANMEILSYVLEGSIAHRDSEGNVQTLSAGDFQLMSAGSGITHSEYNPSKSDNLHFLQIWIKPNQTNTSPRYQELKPAKTEGLQLIVSPDGEAGSMQILQKAWVSRLVLAKKSEFKLELQRSDWNYLQVVSGEFRVGDEVLKTGDGLYVDGKQELALQAASDLEVVVFEV